MGNEKFPIKKLQVATKYNAIFFEGRAVLKKRAAPALVPEQGELPLYEKVHILWAFFLML